MADQPQQLVQKLWNYCNILRDDGLSYGDYPSAWLRTGSNQLTFLLFLKMAEQSKPPFSKPSPIPKNFDWASLLAKDGDELEIHYRHLLETLGREKGMLGVIFRKGLHLGPGLSIPSILDPVLIIVFGLTLHVRLTLIGRRCYPQSGSGVSPLVFGTGAEAGRLRHFVLAGCRVSNGGLTGVSCDLNEVGHE